MFAINTVDLDLLQLGVAGGALLAMIRLARGFFTNQSSLIEHQTKWRADLLEHQTRQQDQILEFFGNHMSESVKIQAEVAEAVRNLTGEVRAMRYEARVRGEVDIRVDE